MVPVSRLEGVTIPVSPQWCSKAPEVPPWPTRSHLYSTWAWAMLSVQQMLQGMNLPPPSVPQGFIHSISPSCWEERGAGTPQPPQPASLSKFIAVTRQRGEDEVQIGSSPALVMEFGGRIILFHCLAWEEHREAPHVPGASSRAHTWAERRRLCPHSCTPWMHLKKRGNCECGKGFS